MSESYWPQSRNSVDPDQATAGRLRLHRQTSIKTAALLAGTCAPMSDTNNYAARELLRDGSQVDIRALQPADEAEMLAAIDRTSAQSLQRRFFVMKRHFSDKERAFFMGSIPGAALGAVIIGLAEQLGSVYIPTYAIVVTFLIMVLVLALRPQGLLARR